MQGDTSDQAPLCVVWVIEGGRSRSDVAALQAVARAVSEAGAQVKIVRHGLGRLSTLQVQRAVRQAKPNVLVSTGVTSTRHLRRLAMRLGCPLVCYYWPSAALIDVHQRSRSTAAQRQSAQLAGGSQRAVLGSEWQRAELLASLRHSGGRSPLAASRMHVLPPLFDDALFAAAAALTPPGARETVARETAASLGVYGAIPADLAAAAAPLKLVSLDGTPASGGHAVREVQQLQTCAGVLVIVHDDHEAREAARRIQVALILGKPVLLCGFGKSGDELPGELQALSFPATLLRTARPSELLQSLGRFCQELGPPPGQVNAPRAPTSEPQPLARLRQVLHPTRVLAEHVALLFEVAAEGAAARAVPSLGERARALSLRLWRRPKTLILRYPKVVAELRGPDLRKLITIDSLERQLQTLLRAGYKPQPLSAMAATAPGTRRTRRGERHLAVTFDGPDSGVTELLAPLLGRLGIPYTILAADAEPAPPHAIRLSEISSLGRRGTFDAQRFWLQLAQSP
jgi:hypothetical protein